MVDPTHVKSLFYKSHCLYFQDFHPDIFHYQANFQNKLKNSFSQNLLLLPSAWQTSAC